MKALRSWAKWVVPLLLALAVAPALAQSPSGGGDAVGSFLFNAINSRLEAAASAASGRFVAYVMPLVLIGTTIYVMVIGLQVMQGRTAAPIQEVAWRVMRIALIVSLFLTAGAYGDSVAGTITGLRDGLANAADPSMSGGVLPTLNNIADIFDKKGSEHAEQVTVWTVMGAGMTHLLASIGFWLCKLILLALALIPLLIATVHLYLGIAVGPLAIACLLFPVTAKYFDSWLSSILVAVMTNVAVALILGFSLSIFQQMANRITAYDVNSVNPLSVVVDLLVALVVLGYAAWKSADLAAQWVGGGSAGNPGGMLAGAALGAGIRSVVSKIKPGNSVKPN